MFTSRGCDNITAGRRAGAGAKDGRTRGAVRPGRGCVVMKKERRTRRRVTSSHGGYKNWNGRRDRVCVCVRMRENLTQ